MNALNSHTDKELLFSMATGDEAAFTAIYNKYWPLLYNTAYKSLKSPCQCKEIVHDVLLDMWVRRSVLQVEDLEAYMKTAVRFRVINFLTRTPTPVFFDLLENVSASSYHAENKLLEKDLLVLVEAWIKVLPEKRRAIFVRYFFKHLSTREIAEELGLSMKTVQNQINTAFHLLRARLAQLFLCIIVFLASFYYTTL